MSCLPWRGLEIPVDILDQDHGGIDDDAEIDGADGQQIGVLAAQRQDDDAEEQRERMLTPTMMALRRSPRKPTE